MNDNAAVIAIGNEVVADSARDTNSSYLTERLRDLGFRIARISLVNDNLAEIVAELRFLRDSCSLIVTTGGLGPTTDDITRHAVAEAFGVRLELSEDTWSKLQHAYEKRGRPLHGNSKQQALFPAGSTIIENPVGTADAFRLETDGASSDSCTIVALPGVPHEMEHLTEHELIPWLNTAYQGHARTASSVLKCFGVSESYVGSQVENCSLPDEFDISYRASCPEILVTFTLSGNAPHKALLEKTRQAAQAARNAIGQEFVFTENPEASFGQAVVELLAEKKLTLAAAESCTGGLLADMLVAVPGASDVFLASAVSYANEAKSVLLGVPPLVLERHGAVSREVAIEMARGVRCRLGADIGVSTTGIAGPAGGSAQKPVGTVWVGLATDEQEVGVDFFYPAGRSRFRLYAAALALDVVRRHLLGYRLSWEKK